MWLLQVGLQDDDQTIAEVHLQDPGDEKLEGICGFSAQRSGPPRKRIKLKVGDRLDLTVIYHFRQTTRSALREPSRR